MKIDRLLSITLLLINRPFVTAKDLSEKYDVSLRTIYRDIDSIIAAGIPVISCPGKGGGYCLRENYRIDRQMLSLNDMTSILMALKGLNTSFNNIDIDDTIEKIECLVPSDKMTQVNQHFENIVIDLTPWYGAEAQKKTLDTINRALRHNRLIYFSYRNLKGEENTRTIEPMTLILKTWCWYVYGFCLKKNDYRLFRLSRITSCTLLEKSFTRREQRFADTDFLKSDSRRPTQITLRFSPQSKNKIEEYFSDSPQTTDCNGNIIITADYPEDEWVFSVLLGFGDACEVLSPPHIRKIISERTKKAAALYIN